LSASRSAVAHQVARFGRWSSSPPQFGHLPSISVAHDAQKVHSKLQIRASDVSDASGVSHFSHCARISSIEPRF
jgi:hypothetical protein